MTGCSWRIRLTKYISQSLKIFQDLVDLEQNLQNEDLVANIVFDPAENEQSKVETFRTLLATFGTEEISTIRHDTYYDSYHCSWIPHIPKL